MSRAVLFMRETPTRPGSISQQAATRAKSGFLANMSHEIRTEAVTSPDVDGLLEGLRKVLDMLFLRSVTKGLSFLCSRHIPSTQPAMTNMTTDPPGSL